MRKKIPQIKRIPTRIDKKKHLTLESEITPPVGPDGLWNWRVFFAEKDPASNLSPRTYDSNDLYKAHGVEKTLERARKIVEAVTADAQKRFELAQTEEERSSTVLREADPLPPRKGVNISGQNARIYIDPNPRPIPPSPPPVSDSKVDEMKSTLARRLRTDLNA